MLLDFLKKSFYGQGADHALAALQKRQLDGPLAEAVSRSREIASQTPINGSKLTRLTAECLFSINSILRTVDDPNEKLHLELICKEVAGEMFRHIVQGAANPSETLRALRGGLEAGCGIGKFNADALIAILKFDRLEDEFAGPENTAQEKFCHYEWFGTESELDDLANDLKASGCIESKKDFKLLFKKNHPENLLVRFNASQIDLIVAVIGELKEKGLLSPRGIRGHFHPLTRYGVDLHGNVLFRTPPKGIWYNLKAAAKKGSNQRENAKAMVSRFNPSRTKL